MDQSRILKNPFETAVVLLLLRDASWFVYGQFNEIRIYLQCLRLFVCCCAVDPMFCMFWILPCANKPKSNNHQTWWTTTLISEKDIPWRRLTKNGSCEGRNVIICSCIRSVVSFSSSILCVDLIIGTVHMFRFALETQQQKGTLHPSVSSHFHWHSPACCY